MYDDIHKQITLKSHDEMLCKRSSNAVTQTTPLFALPSPLTFQYLPYGPSTLLASHLPPADGELVLTALTVLGGAVGHPLAVQRVLRCLAQILHPADTPPRITNVTARTTSTYG